MFGSLQAVINYYKDAPPSAEVQRMLAQGGNTFALIDRPPATVNLPQTMAPPARPTLLPVNDPRDLATIQENNRRSVEWQNQVQLWQAAANASNDPDSYNRYVALVNSGAIQVEGGAVQYPIIAFSQGTPVGGGNQVSKATVTFANLSSGNNGVVRVGDQWRIAISGATPNAGVKVRGGKEGSSAETSMGSTDSSGNFVLTGSIQPDGVGNWHEEWLVGSPSGYVSVGSFSFTVPSTQSSTSTSGTVGQKATDTTNKQTGTAVTTTTPTTQGWFDGYLSFLEGDLDIMGYKVSKKALAVGAVAGAFIVPKVIGGSGRRR